MPRGRVPAWSLFALIACAGALGVALPRLLDAQVYQVGPNPPWVKPIAIPTGGPAAATGTAYEMLLYDYQHSVAPGNVDRYLHVAYRLLDESAVRENSQISINFDSSYQRLTLHSVSVIRDGQVINQLLPDRIRVMQEESQLDFQLLYGSLSVVLVLEDVRRGDVVEYSFTRHGQNPVFKGHYMTMLPTQLTVPLHRFHFRLLWDRSRPPFHKGHLTNLPPAIGRSNGVAEYVWDQGHTPAKLVEGQLPSWYQPLPRIQVSDFATWAEVASWGDSLFVDNAPLPPALSSTIARISASATTPEARVAAALRFVQREVRYLGVEIGVNSHLPYSPATVMKRRYGDCKDKALLLIAMLRALRIEAHPALVSIAHRDHIADYHPTAAIFDHAIVHVVHGGREYWVDPTNDVQHGELHEITPSFRKGLVLGAGFNRIIDMVREPTREPLTDIRVRIDLGAVDSASQMIVSTVYRGAMADQMRSWFATRTQIELQHSYENFYSQLYPGINSVQPPEILDETTGNTIRTTERYSIPTFWRETESKKGHVGTLRAEELFRSIPEGSSSSRTMPLALDHPRHTRYTLEATLKEGWNIKPETVSIAVPSFTFSYRSGTKDSVLTLNFEYRGLLDYVDATSAPAHEREVDKVTDLLTLRVTPPNPAVESGGFDPANINWSILLMGVFVAGIAVAAAVRVDRVQLARLPWDAGVPVGGPVGLQGWLALVGLGVVVSPIVIGVQFANTVSAYSVSRWAALTTPGGSEYHSLYAPVLLFELIANIVFIALACYLVKLFFQRRRLFPVLFVIFLLTRLTVNVLDTIVASGLPLTAGDDTKLSGQAAPIIWVLYMVKSKRVRNTFIA